MFPDAAKGRKRKGRRLWREGDLREAETSLTESGGGGRIWEERERLIMEDGKRGFIEFDLDGVGMKLRGVAAIVRSFGEQINRVFRFSDEGDGGGFGVEVVV